jgi:hypothetical protein
VRISRRLVIEHRWPQRLHERFEHASSVRREPQPHSRAALRIRLEARDLDLQRLTHRTDGQLELGRCADVRGLGGDQKETPRGQRLA